MKTIFFAIAFAFFSLAAAHASIANIDWKSDSSLRYFFRNVDDGLEAKNNVTGRDTSVQHTKSLNYRVSLTAQGKINQWDWQLGIRTKNAANSDFVSFQQNADFAIGIESSFLRYKGIVWNGDLTTTLGRQKGEFNYESNSENLFANAVRWDGLSANFERGVFSIGAGIYSLGGISQGTKGGSSYTTTDHADAVGTTPSSLSFLSTIQPRVQFSLSESVRAKFAVGFLHWARTDSFYSNTIHGGIASVSTGASTGTIAIANARQLQASTSWEFPLDTRLFGEWIKNLETVNYTNTNVPTEDKAWVAGLAYGTTEKVNSAQATYAYLEKGLGSVVSELSSSFVPPDNKGHMVTLAYAAFENITLMGKAYFLEEISLKQSTGAAITSRQNHKTNIWQFNTNISF